MTVEKFSNPLNLLINKLEKGDLVERIFWYEIWFRTSKLIHKKG